MRDMKDNISIENILLFLKMNRKEFSEKYHIVKIGVFGSFSRDQQSSDSDIDLIVEFDNKVNNIYEIKHELRLLFKQKFNRDVDIAREKYLKPRIKKEILKEVVYV